MRARDVQTAHGPLRLPVFVPDATRGAVRTVPIDLVRGAGVRAVLVSTAHLAVKPGASVVKALGGVHAFCGWDGPVVSDSGGFQAFSLLRSAKPLGSVSDKGLRYRLSTDQKYRNLTPESAIEAQLRLGADIVYCLDLCTHPDDPREVQERSVELTLRWAAACRATFDRLVGERGGRGGQRPLLFGIVQGGPHEDLRRRCADGLRELGFDGYGYGGYPIADGRLADEVALVAELLPEGVPLHGLGIGTPESLLAAWRSGYGIFDCTLPTRKGRRGLVYVDLDDTLPAAGRISRQVDLNDERWVRERGPIDAGCDCRTCTTVPAGYVAHLLASGEALGGTLASVHNLRFYTRLTELLPACP